MNVRTPKLSPAKPPATPAPTKSAPTKTPAKTSAPATAKEKDDPPKDQFTPSSELGKDEGETSATPRVLAGITETSEAPRQPATKDSTDSPDSEESPSSVLFRDPDYLEKRDQANTDLAAAKDGSHPELAQMAEENTARRDAHLSEAREQVEATKAKTEEAQAGVDQAESTNRVQTHVQPLRHQAAQDTYRQSRDELDGMQKSGERSPAEYVDALDQNKAATEQFRQEASERYGERQKNLGYERGSMDVRYNLKDRPQLQERVDRYLEIDKQLQAGGLDHREAQKLKQERYGLTRDLSQVRDVYGKDYLSAETQDLSRSHQGHRAHTERDLGQLEQLETRQENLEQHLQKTYGDNQELNPAVDRYRDSKTAVRESTPGAVRAENATRLKEAQTQLDEAKGLQSEAEQGLKDKETQFDSTTGARDTQELAEKKQQLVDQYQRDVDRLGELGRQHLSEAVTHSPGVGAFGGDEKAEFSMSGDTLSFSQGGTTGTARPDGEQGVRLKGIREVDGTQYSFDSHRVPDGKGGYRTESYREKGIEDAQTVEKTIRETEDGTRTQETKTRAHDGSHSSHVTRVTGDDGSSKYTSHEKTPEETSVYSVKKTADGKTETTSQRKDVDGPEFYNSKETTQSDGSSVKQTESFTHFDWDEKSDVEGVTWLWKDSPQDLRNAIGDGATYGRLNETTTVTDAEGNKQVDSQDSERWTSADGKRTLDAVRGQEGVPDRWTYTNRTSDDEVHSQTFLRGTKDTSTTHEYTDDDGFRVTQTDENFSETAEMYKDATGHDIAESGSTTLLEKDSASVEDLEKLAEQYPELKDVFASDAFKDFQEAAGDDRFTLAMRDSEQTMTDGETRFGTQLTAQAADGSTLLFMEGDEGTSVTDFTPGGDDKQGRSRTLTDMEGNRVEASHEGVRAFDGDGSRKTIKGIETLATVPTKVPRALHGARELAHQILNIGEVAKPGEMRKALGKLDELYDSRFGVGIDALGAGLSAFHGAQHMMDGDWGKAGDSYASALTDVGAIASKTGSGFRAASYVDAAGKSAKAWDTGAKLSGVSRVGQLGKALGIAGAAYQGVTGIVDIAQGNHLRGGLGVIGAGGSALAIWGSTSWAGPVGWGVAALATAGTYTVDYVDKNEIAEPTIPLH